MSRAISTEILEWGSRSNPALRIPTEVSAAATVAAQSLPFPGIRDPDAGTTFRTWIRNE